MIMASPAFPFVNPKTIASFFLLFAILTWTLLYGQGMLHTEVLSIERESTPTRPAPVTFEDVAANSPPADPYSSIIDAQNATLGFQKIFVLSLPDRRDKRDLIALSARLSGLDIEFVDGVRGALISKQERPDKWETEFNTDGEVENSLGCWRGHLDIYQKMMKEGIQSALILEDDADWDVMIKNQMFEVARGAKYLETDTLNPNRGSPYGDSWWIMSTGHCAVTIKTQMDQKHWVIDNDPTVVPGRHRQLFFGPDTRPKTLSGAYTRLVFHLDKFVCTGSYAISLQGASQMIYDQEIKLNGKPIDLAMGDFCSEKGQGKCLGVYPPITGIFVPAGDKNKESDRQTAPDGAKNEVAWSKNMVYSTRLNLDVLLDQNTTVQSQYPEDSMLKDFNLSSSMSTQLPEGRPVLITAKEYEERRKEAEAAQAKEEAEKKAKEEAEAKAAQPNEPTEQS